MSTQALIPAAYFPSSVRELPQKTTPSVATPSVVVADARAGTSPCPAAQGGDAEAEARRRPEEKTGLGLRLDARLPPRGGPRLPRLPRRGRPGWALRGAAAPARPSPLARGLGLPSLCGRGPRPRRLRVCGEHPSPALEMRPSPPKGGRSAPAPRAVATGSEEGGQWLRGGAVSACPPAPWPLAQRRAVSGSEGGRSAPYSTGHGHVGPPSTGHGCHVGPPSTSHGRRCGTILQYCTPTGCPSLFRRLQTLIHSPRTVRADT